MAPFAKKDKIDGLLQLAKIHRGLFDERRRTEWKLVFAILAFYLGLITTKITSRLGGNSADVGIPIYLIGAIFLLIATGGILYLKEIHKANHKNKSFAKNAEDAVVSIIKGNTPNLEIFTYAGKNIWKDWSFKGQIIVLGGLAIGSVIGL